MMYILGMTILTFFAVIGAANFITALCRRACRCGRCRIVIDDLDGSNAELRFRCAAKAQDVTGGRIICLCEKDDEAREIVGILCQNHPFSQMMTREELIEEIKNLP